MPSTIKMVGGWVGGGGAVNRTHMYVYELNGRLLPIVITLFAYFSHSFWSSRPRELTPPVPLCSGAKRLQLARRWTSWPTLSEGLKCPVSVPIPPICLPRGSRPRRNGCILGSTESSWLLHWTPKTTWKTLSKGPRYPPVITKARPVLSV